MYNLRRLPVKMQRTHSCLKTLVKKKKKEKRTSENAEDTLVSKDPGQTFSNISALLRRSSTTSVPY